jgi:hypothetical protein
MKYCYHCLFLCFFIFWLFCPKLFAQSEVSYKEISILYYELGNIPCSKGLRWENGKCYYLRCEYGTEAQKKKTGKAEIDITGSHLEAVNIFRKLALSDLEWLSGVTAFHEKKYKCKRTSKMEFSITLKEKGKNKTVRYDFPLVVNCEGKSPFDFVVKLNNIFKLLAKDFPQG